MRSARPTEQELQAAEAKQHQAALAAENVLTTDEQHRLYVAHSDAVTEYWVTLYELQLERVLAHFPGLAPAIRAVWDHVEGGDAGPCGCPEAVA